MSLCTKKIVKVIIEIMPKKFTDEEYAKMLPKKQVGTAVLFFNASNELLVVKPDYRDEWLVPGGSTDENESPFNSAIREVKEEIGLNVTTLQLVGVYYGHAKGVHSDSLKFIFYGGVLDDNQISQIKLQENELTESQFVDADKAMLLLSNSLQKSIPQCLEAIKNNITVYIENTV